MLNQPLLTAVYSWRCPLNYQIFVGINRTWVDSLEYFPKAIRYCWQGNMTRLLIQRHISPARFAEYCDLALPRSRLVSSAPHTGLRIRNRRGFRRFSIFNPRRMRSEGYSSLSVCLSMLCNPLGRFKFYFKVLRALCIACARNVSCKTC